MLEREGVQLALEDGELGLHGCEVRAAEGGTVGSIGGGDGGAVLEGGQANAAAGGHFFGGGVEGRGWRWDWRLEVGRDVG